MARHERVVSGAPLVRKMKAEVATVTLHRTGTRLETAKPRTAESRCAPLRAFTSSEEKEKEEGGNNEDYEDNEFLFRP